jgi:hypothetical protein
MIGFQCGQLGERDHPLNLGERLKLPSSAIHDVLQWQSRRCRRIRICVSSVVALPVILLQSSLRVFLGRFMRWYPPGHNSPLANGRL